MAANQSARRTRLLINNIDFTPCMISFEGSDNHTDQSGLMSFTGTIVLGNAIDFSESIDDRKNPTVFCRGNPIILEITDSSGTLRRHPRGALRILTASYDSQTQRQTLEVGDLITLLNFKEPTDPDTAGAKYSEGLLVFQVIENLLEASGFENYNLSNLPFYRYYYPLNLSGSYLQSLGKILYTNNRIGWIDSQETFRIEFKDIQPQTSLVALTEGVNEIYYRRLAGAEAPAELIRATGTEINSLIYSINSKSVSERYAFISQWDNRQADGEELANPYIEGYTITEKEIRETEWNAENHYLQTTTTTEKPFILVIPEVIQEQFVNFDPFALREETIVIEKFFYEQEQCKLTKKEILTYSERANYLAEIVEFDPESFVIISSLIGLRLTKKVEENYEYDEKDRVRKIATKTEELTVILLNGTDEDWDEWFGVPDYFIDSEYTEQEWKELSKDVWEYSTFTLQPQVRVNPESIDPEGEMSASQRVQQKLQLILATSEKRISSSGQEVPPAAERCPVTDNKIEENQVSAEANFEDICENNFKPRERTYSADFLAGRQFDMRPGIFTISTGSPAEIQLENIARTEGRLLWGRYKGQEIAAPIANTMFDDFKPLFGVHVTERDGTAQNYLADGCSWVVGQQEALWACDGIWVGESASPVAIADNVVEPGVIIPSFIEPQDKKSGMGMGAFIFSYPYLLETIESTLPVGLGLGANFTSDFTMSAGMGVGAEFVAQIPSLYWDEVEWDSTDENTWNQLDVVPSQSSNLYWDEVEWDSTDENAWNQLDVVPSWINLDTVDWDNIDWDNLNP